MNEAELTNKSSRPSITSRENARASISIRQKVAKYKIAHRA